MVDVIKPFLHGSTAFPIKSHNPRLKAINHQVTLPIFVSQTENLFTNDRINNNQTKRWIGNASSNPFHRPIDVSNAPYSLHRKIMYQELSRRCPISVDSSKGPRNKATSLSKERTKTSTTGTITTTTTMTGFNIGNYVLSQASFSNGDIQSSRLFDTLSKPVTIKPEPLRPVNTLNTTTANVLTSWQRYWASTHAQRRRKEVTDPGPEPNPVLYRPKREPTKPNETQFVVSRDTPQPHNEIRQFELALPSPRNSNTPARMCNSTVTSEKEVSPRKESDSKRTTPEISTVDINVSSLIPSPVDMQSSTVISKNSTVIATKATDKDDEKDLIEKSLLLSSSSHFRSDSQIIEDVSQAQFEPQPVTTKAYQLTLADEKAKKNKRSPSRRKRTRSRPKSADKRRALTPTKTKRKRQTSNNKKSSNSSDLSSVFTISKSKYSCRDWDKPYVGLRFDPPTPPSSPSLFVWLEDSDHDDDDDTPRDKPQAFEQKSSEKVSKK